MKKLLFYFLVILGLSSCAMKGTQYGEYGQVTDYSQYNMFITEATAVSFDYQPVGSVVSYVKSGYRNGDARDGNYVKATPDAAVRQLVDNAIKIGAYGIINVKIEFRNAWDDEYKVYVGTYTATGMAIKW